MLKLNRVMREKLGAELVQHFVQLSETIGQESGAAVRVRAEIEHGEFERAFKAGYCYICGKPLATFSTGHACLHWLLRPNGFKKQYFPLVVSKFDIFQMQAYLRWVANSDAPLRNINDLPEEGTGKLLECTIRYRELEWSFSCSESDLAGHETSAYPQSREPHFHFQMRIGGHPFILFNEFHLPLRDEAAIYLEAIRINPEIVRPAFVFGQGIRELLECDEAISLILNSATGGADPIEAPLRIQSMIVADEGTTISGEKIYALIQEARVKGVSAASMLHKLPNVTSETVITPGAGVVVQAPRAGGRK